MKYLPNIPLYNLSDSTLAAIVADLRTAAARCDSLSYAVPIEYEDGLARQGEGFTRDANAIEAYAMDQIVQDEARRARNKELLNKHRALCRSRN